MECKPARHEHERGAPLIDDCDGWCKFKYKRWKENNLNAEGKGMSECNDCHSDILSGVVRASSIKIGEYYAGPEICHACSEKRYEHAVREIEEKQWNTRNDP